MSDDVEHLRLLAIFHYVVGGVAALFAMLPIFHLIVGVFLILLPGQPGGSDAVPTVMGWIFVLFAGALIALGLALSTCIILTGRFLQQRKRYLFCLVVAGVECVFMPFGTVLGIFTIMVLMREPVKLLFAA